MKWVLEEMVMKWQKQKFQKNSYKLSLASKVVLKFGSSRVVTSSVVPKLPGSCVYKEVLIRPDSTFAFMDKRGEGESSGVWGREGSLSPKQDDWEKVKGGTSPAKLSQKSLERREHWLRMCGGRKMMCSWWIQSRMLMLMLIWGRR